MEQGIGGQDLVLSWFIRRIQPLQHRNRLMHYYSGKTDSLLVTTDDLTSDALDKRMRKLVKVARDVHTYKFECDMYTNGTCPDVSFWNLSLFLFMFPP
jgi:hypothetical protein